MATGEELAERARRRAADHARNNPPPPPAETTRHLENQLIFVEAAAGMDWNQQALLVVRQIAEQRLHLSIDDVRPHLPPTDNNKSAGPVMIAAIKRGFIKPMQPAGAEHLPATAHIAIRSPYARGSSRPLYKSMLYPHR